MKTTSNTKNGSKSREITICLHCGCDPKVVESQMNALSPLRDTFNVYWNNRIDRHPACYNSFSQLINDSVATSLTEFVILINDRCKPKAEEVYHMMELLNSGYAAVTKYSVGFMGFSKQLIRKIGWWDERFFGGGYEDDDFVLRLRLANLAYYESEEAEYDQTWKSPLFPKGAENCKFSQPWFKRKWKIYSNEIVRVEKEMHLCMYDGVLDPPRLDVEKSWKDWSHSQIGIMFKERMQNNKGGASRTKWFMKDDYKTEFRKVRSLV